MRRRKRDRKTIRKPEEPKEVRSKLAIPEDIEASTAPYSDDQGEPKGMAQAVASFNSYLRRPEPRDPLRDIDRLTRPKDRRGNA